MKVKGIEDPGYFSLDRVEYERELYSKGFEYITGVDEVGRGPLAGPVVAGAVIFPARVWTGDLSQDEGLALSKINDSKKLSEKKSMVDHEKIDEINILQATKLAMKLALEECNKVLGATSPAFNLPAHAGSQPEKINSIHHVLIDALTLEGLNLPQAAIVKGDGLSLSIGAASIIAKVTRDRLMVAYDEIYPHYGFKNNKGYGTKAHYEGIRAVGLCPIHRKTFVH